MNVYWTSDSWRLIVVAWIALTCAPGFGQIGVSSGSVGYAAATRGLTGSAKHFGRNRIELADIRVEEFVNYHQHQIPMPRGDERVHLDLRFNRIDEKTGVLQVGLATARAIDLDSVRPLNLVLVVDRSGSMAGDRIANVKRALRSFIGRMRPQDAITLVAFSTEAEFVIAGSPIKDREKIETAIDRLSANGSTNLHAGLMLGYEEAQERFSPKKTNRVILLTDGIANVGTTDAKEIAAQSRSFNEQGIDLATIGLGHDFNQDLLRTLADAGRGLMHFVDDTEDIQKTFVRELDSLLTPGARDVELTIDFGKASRLMELYGYQPELRGAKVTLNLDDLNQGATQVVISKVRIPNRPTTIRVTLSYRDANSGKPVEGRQSILLPDDDDRQTVLADVDVRKNFVIARLANAIKKSVPDAGAGDFQSAAKHLSRALVFARDHFPQDHDADVDRIVDIAKAYERHVNSAMGRDDRDGP